MASANGNNAPASWAEDVTPSDSAEKFYRALYVGTQGDVTVDVLDGGTNLTFKSVEGVFPISVTRVYSTGTTATDIMGLR